MWTSLRIQPLRHWHLVSVDHVLGFGVDHVGTYLVQSAHVRPRAKHLPITLFATTTMTRIPVRNPDSDDDKQWEDLPDEKWAPHSRSSTPSGSFKGASAARTRRTRQRAIFPSTSPRKHNPGDYRTPIRARRERFFVELPPQDLGTARPKTDFPIRPFLQEPIGTVSVQFCI